jgi:hypothetical protein
LKEVILNLIPMSYECFILTKNTFSHIMLRLAVLLFKDILNADLIVNLSAVLTQFSLNKETSNINPRSGSVLNASLVFAFQ